MLLPSLRPRTCRIREDAPDVRLTVSIRCHLADPTETIGRMLTAADDALYSAKQAGPNRVVIATPAGT